VSFSAKKPLRRLKRAWFLNENQKSEAERERNFLAGEIDSVFLAEMRVNSFTLYASSDSM